MKKKKQDPKKRAQDKFDRPFRPDRRTDSQIRFEEHHGELIPGSPNFGQDKAWVREGRDPSWSKDREHLMRIFNKNVEDMLEPASYTAPLRDKLAGVRFHSDREARYLKEYNATGLGDISRSMRLAPVPIGLPKTWNVALQKFDNAGAWENREMRKEYKENFKHSDRYKNEMTVQTSVDTLTGKTQTSPTWRGSESLDVTASSIPRKQVYSRGEEQTVWLDHNRDKSLDTPAVAREMAHYDQLHGYLQKQDKGARAALNVFRGRGFTRR
jgi:hypothetical protein